MSILFKYVFASNDEYYNKYRIEEKVNDDFYLVKNIDNKDNGLHLFNIHQMVSLDSMNFWKFFNTEEELKSYIDWLETPDNPKENVVKLVKKGE